MLTLIKRFVPHGWREHYWHYLQRKDAELRNYLHDKKMLGPEAAWRLTHSRFYPLPRVAIALPGYPGRFHFRPRTSDVAVVRQVFSQREYEPIVGLDDVQVILDAGANIGCTSAFLAAAYPTATIIAVEPDADNYALCKRNLATFGKRVLCVHGAVWPTNTLLTLSRGQYRDGREWSIQVRPASAGDGDTVAGITMDRLLETAGCTRLDLLKIDIERSERELFSAPDRAWLERTRNIAIELHDEACAKVFQRAMSGFTYQKARSGELTLCYSIRRQRSVSH